MKANKYHFFQLMKEHSTRLVERLDQNSSFRKLLLKRQEYYQHVVKLLEKRIYELVKGDLKLEDEIYAKLLEFFSCYLMESGCIHFKCYDNERNIDFSSFEQFYYIATLYKKGKHKKIRVDYFLAKDTRFFLFKELNGWIAEQIARDIDIISNNNIVKLKIVEEIINYAIDLIAEFEDKLLALWKSPRKIITEGYVITFDRISANQSPKAPKILESIFLQLKEQYRVFSENKAQLQATKQKHKRFSQRFEDAQEITDQFSEWYLLDLIDENFVLNDLWSDEHQTQLNAKYRFLPLDTKFFHGLKEKLEELFVHINEVLDGYLIKSDNLQAMQSLLSKFRGQIQLAYIDPPFNTGTLEYNYYDAFKRETWLTMLCNRLETIKELLHDTGSLYLHLNPLCQMV